MTNQNTHWFVHTYSSLRAGLFWFYFVKWLIRWRLLNTMSKTLWVVLVLKRTSGRQVWTSHWLVHQVHWNINTKWDLGACNFGFCFHKDLMYLKISAHWNGLTWEPKIVKVWPILENYNFKQHTCFHHDRFPASVFSLDSSYEVTPPMVDRTSRAVYETCVLRGMVGAQPCFVEDVEIYKKFVQGKNM